MRSLGEGGEEDSVSDKDVTTMPVKPSQRVMSKSVTREGQEVRAHDLSLVHTSS
jgi:hypothetical protein